MSRWLPIPKIDWADVQLALTMPCMIDKAQQAYTCLLRTHLGNASGQKFLWISTGKMYS